MVSPTEPKVNQSNTFKLYLSPPTWRTVRRIFKARNHEAQRSGGATLRGFSYWFFD